VAEAAKRVGNQSVVVVLDVKKNLLDGKYEVWALNGSKNTCKSPAELALQMERLGAGEIVINSIDNDGNMKGYDLDLIEMVKESISVPLTVLGGAGTFKDIGQLISRYGVIGAAAGSLFVFKGVHKAVLINYPNKIDKEALIKKSLHITGSF
jgi:cyclase